MVITALIVALLRKAPVVGRYFFKPLFDLIWFLIALSVLMALAWLVIQMMPDGAFTDSVPSVLASDAYPPENKAPNPNIEPLE